MNRELKINPDFVLVLDILALPGRPPILFVVDKETRGLSSHELGADITADIIKALTHEIDIVGLLPVAIETDNSIRFSTAGLADWLCERGIQHRYLSPYRPSVPIAEAMIRLKAGRML